MICVMGTQLLLYLLITTLAIDASAYDARGLRSALRKLQVCGNEIGTAVDQWISEPVRRKASGARMMQTRPPILMTTSSSSDAHVDISGLDGCPTRFAFHALSDL